MQARARAAQGRSRDSPVDITNVLKIWQTVSGGSLTPFPGISKSACSHPGGTRLQRTQWLYQRNQGWTPWRNMPRMQ